MQQKHDQPVETGPSSQFSPSLSSSPVQSEREGSNSSPLEGQSIPRTDLETTLSQEAQQIQRHNRAIVTLMCAPVLWLVILAAIDYLLRRIWPMWSLPSWLVGMPPVLWIVWYSLKHVIPAGEVDTSSTGTKQRRALTELVARQSGIHSIGPLIDACGLDDRKTSRIAIEALTPLLARIDAEYAPPLTHAHLACLCSLVDRKDLLHRDLLPPFSPEDSRMIDFRIAALRALPYVGGREALPVVRKLATEAAATQGERQIQQEAIACLPILERRVAEIEISDTLLRPADASEVDADSLLRAGAESHPTNSSELLRASSTEPGTRGN